MSNSDLLNMLQGQFSEEMIDQLSRQIGGADREKTAAAASGIMTTLTGALAKNTSSNEGASALSNALDRDHDGSVLDDIMGMVSGQRQPANERALNGQGILNHVLGDRQNNAVNMISKLSGLDDSKTGNLMSMLAPVVMGMLGKTKREQGLDAAGIASLLSGTVSANQQNDPTMNLVTRFLDSDGDGSIVDDVANIGLKMLGSFFKKR